MSGLMDGMRHERVPGVDGAEVDLVVGGEGPAVLLLHGFPQTKVMWHPVLPGLRERAEVLHVVNPADWARQGMVAGTPFALAHTFAQTGPFRPANTVRGIENAVLAGSSTVPGVGVPTALISGRLAADRITGIVEESHRGVVTKAGRS